MVFLFYLFVMCATFIMWLFDNTFAIKKKKKINGQHETMHS